MVHEIHRKRKVENDNLHYIEAKKQIQKHNKDFNGTLSDEKRKEAISYLKDKENTLLAERLIDIATDDEMGKKIYKKFWKMGECITAENNIILRKVQDSDKDKTLEEHEFSGSVTMEINNQIYFDDPDSATKRTAKWLLDNPLIENDI